MCNLRQKTTILQRMLKLWTHKKWCNDNTTCWNCSNKHPESTECNLPKRNCRYCHDDHITGHRETKLHWEISKKMALERTDRNTARKKIQEGEFPTLQNTKTNENYTSTTTAQQRIKEWQNPNSWANIAARNEIQEKVINDLKTETIKLHKYIKSMMDTLQKNDSHGLWKSLKEESTNITSKKNGTT